MAKQNILPAAGQYDARWFIWTIVFLVVTGISLVSYIVLSENGTSDGGVFVSPATALAQKKAAK